MRHKLQLNLNETVTMNRTMMCLFLERIGDLACVQFPYRAIDSLTSLQFADRKRTHLTSNSKHCPTVPDRQQPLGFSPFLNCCYQTKCSTPFGNIQTNLYKVNMNMNYSQVQIMLIICVNDYKLLEIGQTKQKLMTTARLEIIYVVNFSACTQ